MKKNCLKVLSTVGMLALTCSSVALASQIEPENSSTYGKDQAFYGIKLENFATNKHGTFSGYFENYVPKNAVDGNTNSFWAVKASGKQEYITIDMEQARNINLMTIKWSMTNYPKQFTVQGSNNGSSWQTIKTLAGQGGTQSIQLPATNTRYVKISFSQSNSAYFTVYEIGIYNSGNDNNNNNNNNNNGSKKNFIVTNVQDNLDANDAKIMANKLTEMGYSKVLQNSNVSSADMKNYLARKDINMLYHTGHGNNGYIATAGGGLNVSQVQTYPENVFYATCLTLTDTNFKTVMQPTCKNVFGYTNYSFDIADDTVVEKMTNSMKAGKSLTTSWYLANSAVSSLRDRWCNYSRQGGQIVEYSARTSNNPSYASWQAIDSTTNIKVNSQLLQDTRTFEKEFAFLKNNNVTVKSYKESSSNSSYGEECLSDQIQSKDKAVEVANQWIKANNRQKDFCLDTISPVDRKINGSSQTVGYIVSYVRMFNGVKVKNNINEENIALIVSNNKISAFTQRINENELKSGRTYDEMKVLPVNAALKKAAANIARIIKRPDYKIASVEPCFSYQHSKLIPAYQVIDDSGSSLIVSALNGEVIF